MLKYIAIGIVTILFLLLFSFSSTKEYYGGKIKNIKRIPFNNCERICGTYLQDCLNKYQHNDAGWCHERFGPMGTCVSECYYSNHHRM